MSKPIKLNQTNQSHASVPNCHDCVWLNSSTKLNQTHSSRLYLIIHVCSLNNLNEQRSCNAISKVRKISVYQSSSKKIQKLFIDFQHQFYKNKEFRNQKCPLSCPIISVWVWFRSHGNPFSHKKFILIGFEVTNFWNEVTVRWNEMTWNEANVYGTKWPDTDCLYQESEKPKKPMLHWSDLSLETF